jgi:1,4-dihydroxy-2-naphthoyl-CoA hydrolase
MGPLTKTKRNRSIDCGTVLRMAGMVDPTTTTFPTFNPRVAEALPEYTKRSPYASLLGIEVVNVEPGAIRCRLPVREALSSGVGAMHGGAIVSLVDHALSLAVYPLVEIGKWVATLEFKVNYLAPVRPDATAIVADARVLTLKRTLAVVRVDVTVDPSGTLVASTQGTAYVREKPGS